MSITQVAKTKAKVINLMEQFVMTIGCPIVLLWTKLRCISL